MPSQAVSMSWQRRGMRELSCEIKIEWEKIQEFTKQRLEKLPNLTPGDLGTETTAGQIKGFDSAWDRVRYNKPKKIPAFKGEQSNKLIIQDPIIQQLAQDGKAQIFASDTAAAALMTSTKA